jgi:hypothetical protein
MINPHDYQDSAPSRRVLQQIRQIMRILCETALSCMNPLDREDLSSELR